MPIERISYSYYFIALLWQQKHWNETKNSIEQKKPTHKSIQKVLKRDVWRNNCWILPFFSTLFLFASVFILSISLNIHSIFVWFGISTVFVVVNNEWYDLIFIQFSRCQRMPSRKISTHNSLKFSFNLKPTNVRIQSE